MRNPTWVTAEGLRGENLMLPIYLKKYNKMQKQNVQTVLNLA